MLLQLSWLAWLLGRCASSSRRWPRARVAHQLSFLCEITVNLSSSSSVQHQTFVYRSPPLHIYNSSVTANNTSLVVFFLLSPLAPSLSMFTKTGAPFSHVSIRFCCLCHSIFRTCINILVLFSSSIICPALS